MKQFKITFTINGRYSASVFNYANDQEKDEKLKAWKQEHLTAYNDVQVLSYIEDWDNGTTDRVTSNIYIKNK
jgi:hypothetical protein